MKTMMNKTSKFGTRALAGLAAGLLLGSMNAGAAGAAAGATVSNTGYFEYLPDGAPIGTTSTQTSNPVDLTVTQVFDISVTNDGTVATPGQTVSAKPGDNAVLTYTVSNPGNGTDTIRLNPVNELGNPIPGAVVFIDTNADGLYTPGEEVTIVQLPADGSQVVRVYVPTNPDRTASTGGSNDLVNLIGTSFGPTNTGPAGEVDNNNVGQIVYDNVVNLTLDANNAFVATAGATRTVTHTITNTGNTTIDPNQLAVTTTPTGVLASAGSSVTYTVTNGGGAAGTPNTDLAAALIAAGPLAPGATYSVLTTYVVGGGTDGQTGSNVITVMSTVVDDTTSTVKTDNEMTAAAQDTDSATLQQGVVTLTKTGLYCGLDSACLAPVAITAGQVRPGDFVLYTVNVVNNGSAPILMPTLRDYVPRNTVFSSVVGETNDAVGNPGIMYAVSPTALRTGLTWTPTAPVTLAPSTTATSGPFVFVGVDTNSNATVDAADRLLPNGILTLRLIVQVRATGASN